MSHILTFIGVVCFAVLLSYVGPRMEEIDASHRDAVAAEKQAAARVRFERAAQAMCGENAGWRELADGAVQCYTHRGHPTRRVSL